MEHSRRSCGTSKAAMILLQGPGVLMLQAEVAYRVPRTKKPLIW
jgi:hypothetical protein